MKFYTKEFKINKPEIIREYEKNGLESVAEFCVLSGIHLIAGFTFVSEHDTVNEEVREKLDKLMSFYGYTEVVNED